MSTKTCRTCGETKPAREFYRAREYKGTVYRFADCMPCTRAKEREKYWRTKGCSSNRPPTEHRKSPSIDWLRRPLR